MGGVRDHRDPGLNAKGTGGVGALDGDIGELAGVGVEVDGAVAIDKHLIG